MQAVKNIEEIVSKLIKDEFDEVTIKDIWTNITQSGDECEIVVDVEVCDAKYRYDTDEYYDNEQYVKEDGMEIVVDLKADEEPTRENFYNNVGRVCDEFKFSHQDQKGWVNEPEFNYD